MNCGKEAYKKINVNKYLRTEKYFLYFNILTSIGSVGLKNGRWCRWWGAIELAIILGSKFGILMPLRGGPGTGKYGLGDWKLMPTGLGKMGGFHWKKKNYKFWVRGKIFYNKNKF